jgi:hypothetical protein
MFVPPGDVTGAPLADAVGAPPAAHAHVDKADLVGSALMPSPVPQAPCSFIGLQWFVGKQQL